MANNTDAEDELLDANYSPEREEDLNKKPNTNTGVKKLNGKPLYIVIFTFLVISLSLGYAMYQRGQMNKHDAQEKEVSKQRRVIQMD
ncbi:MAG: hypothetical protein Q9M36_06775 [Sulfurovum sp.]|nr:hypothetical protein [Sulfurovum sp.]